MAATRNATLTKDSIYYVEQGNNRTQTFVAFTDKRVRLLGRPVEGRQRFQTGLGHTAFTSESNVIPDKP